MSRQTTSLNAGSNSGKNMSDQYMNGGVGAVRHSAGAQNHNNDRMNQRLQKIRDDAGQSPITTTSHKQSLLLGNQSNNIGAGGQDIATDRSYINGTNAASSSQYSTKNTND